MKLPYNSYIIFFRSFIMFTLKKTFIILGITILLIFSACTSGTSADSTDSNTTSIKELKAITFSVSDSNITTTQTPTLGIVGLFDDGSSAPLDSGLTFSISDTSLINITGDVVTALRAGNVTISVSKDGIRSNPVTINIQTPIVLSSIELSSSSVSLILGDSATLSLVGSYSDGTTAQLNATNFDIADTNVVSVNNSIITALNVGTTGMSITYAGVTSNVISISVVPVPVTLTSVLLSSSKLSLEVGQNATLSLAGSYSDGTQVVLSSQTYTIGDAALCSITNDTVLAKQSGLCSINTTYNGINSNTLNISISVTSNINTTNLEANAFAKEHIGEIPADATVEEYDAERFCILSGKVYDNEKNPLEGVKVSIYGYPEYGSTLSKSDGTYSMATEAGSSKTIQMQKNGYTVAHRNVVLPKLDFAHVEDTILETVDSVVTKVFLGGAISLHRSTTNTDSFGSRATTLVFDGVTLATVTKADDTTEVLREIDVRATEFKTPDSMPSPLPSTSAFTFCSDMSIDGVDADSEVSFDKPVLMYVENFLGFDVGTIVPIGYYSYQKAKWIASKNGVVVKLLDSDGDGNVDGVDATGDDVADDLNNDGFTSDEVSGITSYSVGGTYWRAEVDHFTPWDMNWPYGPPPSAKAPNAPPPPAKPKDNDNCKKKVNSYIDPLSQVFHEDIAISGTSLTLHYASNRTPGYNNYSFEVPIVGDEISPDLKEVVLTVTIAGKLIEKRITDAAVNQNVRIDWDGLDAKGNIVRGAIDAYYNIEYLYDAVYYESSEDFANAFLAAGENPTGIRAREEIGYEQKNKIELFIPTITETAQIAQGWTLSNHDVEVDEWLQKGDGTNEKKKFPIYSVKTIAGNGQTPEYYGFREDNVSVLEQRLPEITDIKLDTNGALNFLAKSYLYRINSDNTPESLLEKEGASSLGFDVLNDLGQSVGDLNSSAYALRNAKNVAFDTQNNAYVVNSESSCAIVTKITDTTVENVVGYCASWRIDPPQVTQASDYDGKIAKEINFGYNSADYGILDIQVGKNSEVYLLYKYSNSLTELVMLGTDGILHHIAGIDSTERFGDPKEIGLGYAKKMFIDEHDNLYFYSGTSAQMFDRNKNEFVNLGEIPKLDGSTPTVRMRDRNGFLYAYMGTAGLYKLGFRDGEVGEWIHIAGTGLDGVLMSENTFANDTYIRGTLFAIDESSEITIARPNLSNHDYDHPYAYKLYFDKKNNKFRTYHIDGQIDKVITDGNTTMLEYVYDADNQLIEERDLFGNKTLINRGSDGKVGSIVAAGGQRTTLNYDGDNLSSIHYEDGSRYSFVYDANGLMTKMTNQNNEEFRHIFDGNGHVSRVEDSVGASWDFLLNETPLKLDYSIQTALGNSEHYIYYDTNGSSRKSEVISACGSVQTLFSIADGMERSSNLCGMTKSVKNTIDESTGEILQNLLSVTTPSGLQKVSTRSDEYNSTSGIQSVTFETNSKTTNISENFNTGVVTTTSPEGRVSTEEYNVASYLATKKTFGSMNPLVYSYNTKGQLASIQSQDRVETFLYNDRHELTSRTNALGERESYEYDLLGRVTKKTYPDGTSNSYGYDAAGNLTSFTTPNGFVHNYTFNGVNHKSSYKNALAKSTRYIYNAERNITQIIMPSAKSVVYDYDKGRLLKITTPDEDTDYTYTCKNLASISNADTTLSYEYDGTLLTKIVNTGSLNSEISMQYNNDLLMKTLTYAGVSDAIVYDSDGLIKTFGDFTVSLNSQNAWVDEVNSPIIRIVQNHNLYGEIDTKNYIVNAKTAYAYNVINRDETGKITKLIESIKDVNITWEYTYDTNARLTSVKENSRVVENFSYDNSGNRINTNVYNATFTDNDSVDAVNDKVYIFNDDGYLESITTPVDSTAFTYNVLGQLSEVSFSSGTKLNYVYNGKNQLVAKLRDGVVEYKYLWKDFVTLLAVYDGSDNLLQRFNYGGGELPFSVSIGTKEYTLGFNQVDSLRTVIDEEGNNVKSISYDSYGYITQDTNASFYMPFGFAGGLYDVDTKLTHFGYRDYDALSATWTARDPIDIASEDLNFYRYVLNDPINYNDPTGLKSSLKEKADKAKELYDKAKKVKEAYDECKKVKESTDCISKAGESGDVEDMIEALRNKRSIHKCAHKLTDMAKDALY